MVMRWGSCESKHCVGRVVNVVNVVQGGFVVVKEIDDGVFQLLRELRERH